MTDAITKAYTGASRAAKKRTIHPAWVGQGGWLHRRRDGSWSLNPCFQDNGGNYTGVC